MGFWVINSVGRVSCLHQGCQRFESVITPKYESKITFEFYYLVKIFIFYI